jgi:NADPH:quinone reductase-like Zn-dependent oxidoreductase
MRGERVLVYGAAGCVGVAAMQIARHFGAHVTGVCSDAKVEMVRSLGADAVIDYGSADFAASGERWDAILDTVGNAPFAPTRQALNDKGRLLLVASGLPELLEAPFQSMTSGRTVAGGPAPGRPEDLALLAILCEAGTVRPVIDGSYPLVRIVEAHARVESGRKTGSVVVTMDGEPVHALARARREPYLLRPSHGRGLSLSTSIASMLRRLMPTEAAPSGAVPSAWLSTPHAVQKR